MSLWNFLEYFGLKFSFGTLNNSSPCSRDEVRRKLVRFIVYGCDSVAYVPGSRLAPRYYEEDNISSLRMVLHQMDIEAVLEMIQWVQWYKKYIVHRETIPLILSECYKIAECKDDVLEFVTRYLRTGEEFLLFIKFSFEIHPSITATESFLAMIRNWYACRPYVDLLRMIAFQPTYQGWSHAQLITMSDFQASESSGKMPMCVYALGGLQKVNEECDRNDDAVDFFNEVEAFRIETDPEVAAREMEEYRHEVSDIHPSLAFDLTVWEAVLKAHCSVEELMDKVEGFCKSGALRATGGDWHSDFVQQLCDRLTDANVRGSRVLPARSLIEIQRIKNEAIINYQHALKENTILVLPKINKVLVEALELQMAQAFDNVKNANIKGIEISVIIDCEGLDLLYCGYTSFVKAHLAAAVLALSLRRAASKARILTLNNGTTIPLEETSSVYDLANEIAANSTAKCTSSGICNFMDFENPYSKTADLFVVIGNSIDHCDYLKVVQSHFATNPKKPKFVFVRLDGVLPRNLTYHSRILQTTGFDETLFSVISAFVNVKADRFSLKDHIII